MAALSLEAPAPGRLRRRRLPLSLWIGGALTLTVVLAALLAPWIAPYPFDQMHPRDRFHPPGMTYLMGADEYGRDVLSRALDGSRLSLFMGFVAPLIALAIGVPIGLVAGYARGWFDEVSMRVLDLMMAFPPLLLVLLILTVTEPSLWKTTLAVGILFVPATARLARSVTLDIVQADFVAAAKARGEGPLYILFREILPNIWPPVAVEGSLRISFAVLLAALLSFLGFGVQPPSADWGLMISGGRSFVQKAPWIVLAPGLLMAMTVIGVNLMGDGLRDMLDAKLPPA